jgi:hypothetical protein
VPKGSRRYRHEATGRSAHLTSGAASAFLRLQVLSLCLAAGLTGNARAAEDAGSPIASASVAAAAVAPASLERQWGIQVSGLFLSAGGNMVDFRYRVLDPAKAAALTKADIKPSLLDQTTGAKLIVPSTPKVGQLRQTVQRPVAGKIYFMLFANTRHHVKKGDKVTIIAGDFKAENLAVE